MKTIIQQTIIASEHQIKGDIKNPLDFLDDYSLTKTISHSKPKITKCDINTSVNQMLKWRLEDMLDTEGAEDAFFVGDIGEVHRQYKRWVKNLPRIEPYYAVKCNPDPHVLDALSNLGIGFDCASKSEIQAVLDLGVSPSRIIYANPCKQNSMIRFAQNNSVSLMTFDNADELYKIKKCFPEAKLVLRILTDDSKSVCKFGTKFGAHLDVTLPLLEKAKELDLDVVGVSFHVGSGCYDAMAFADAVRRARVVFDQGASVGYTFSLLDVGGGFPSNVPTGITFEQMAAVLGPAVDELFPESVRVIAEPGRFFVASAFTLAVNITARRSVSVKSTSPDKEPENQFMFYVNDGVYGSFNCILFDHAVITPRVLLRDGEFLHGTSADQSGIENEPKYLCSIWGPTCDSMDLISKKEYLPKLDVGDWLYFDFMGAYTICAASNFNGFKKSNILYTNTEL